MLSIPERLYKDGENFGMMVGNEICFGGRQKRKMERGF
jgi:hypothetical protein